MKSAVLMIVFCRPDTTRKVFEAVRKARPPRLYIAADSPRMYKEGEKNRCEQVRKIFDDIDWPCKVYRRFRTENMGCSKGPYDAISWFFENEIEGVILEDDIIPIPDFFKFCDEMLEKYRHNDNVQSISGWSYFYDNCPSDYAYSYYFSRMTSSWGWATWKRVWNDMDLTLKSISLDTIESYLNTNKFPKRTKKLYLDYFKKIKKQYDIIQSWDYQFLFSMWRHNRFVVQPLHSMTCNIGFSDGATHKFDKSISLHGTQTIYPISYPSDVRNDFALDLLRIDSEKLYWRSRMEWKCIGLWKRIKNVFKWR